MNFLIKSKCSFSSILSRKFQRISFRIHNIRYSTEKNEQTQIIIVGSGLANCPKTVWVRNTSRLHANNIVFNPVENLRRIQSGSRQRLKKTAIETIGITQMSSETSGGLSGFMLTAQLDFSYRSGLKKMHIFGPPGSDKDVVKQQTKNIQSSIYHSDVQRFDVIHDLENPRDNSCAIQMECIPIIPQTKNSEASNRVSEDENDTGPDPSRGVMTMAYLCKPSLEILLGNKIKELDVLRADIHAARKNNQILIIDEHILHPQEFFEVNKSKNRFLVIGCPTKEHLQALEDNETINKCIQSQDEDITLVIHYTPRHIEESAEYEAWINRFGENTHHLILNDKSPGAYLEVIHEQQIRQNFIHEGIFPLLHEEDNYSKSTEIKGNRVYPACFSYYTFHLNESNDPVPLINRLAFPVNKEAVIEELKSDPLFMGSLMEFKRKLASFTTKDMVDEREWPEVVILGTQGGVPCKTRNTTGILVNISEEKSILFDPSAGTRDQLLALYGYERTKKLLTEKLVAILITHKHHDHWHGIDSILYDRWCMLKEAGMPREPVLVMCGYDVVRDIEALHARPGVPTHETINLVTFEDFAHFGSNEFSQKGAEFLKALGLRYLTFPRMLHCRNARGIVLETEEGYKLSFSGDSLPCKSFANMGMNSDLLIHDATFYNKQHAHSRIFSQDLSPHSTQGEALTVGRQMKAKFTMLTHYSGLFNGATPVQMEPFKTDQNYGYAEDFMKVRPCDLHIVAHLTPVFLALHKDKLTYAIQRISERKIFTEHERRKFLLGNTKKSQKARRQSALASGRHT